MTHAMCVGMTGSGKTGLGLTLIEEAALDGIPVIADRSQGRSRQPAAHVSRSQPEDFVPWVNPDEASHSGISVEESRAEQAERWRQGLEEWGQDADRIQRLRDSAEFTIYTPGSNAGMPDFRAEIVRRASRRHCARMPSCSRDRVGTAGVERARAGRDRSRSDPQPRAHPAREHPAGAWRRDAISTLPSSIHQVQSPPLTKVGVLDLDTFYPPKDRFDLAMQLNNLLAAPGFATWLSGEPLDVGRLLFGAERQAARLDHFDRPPRRCGADVLRVAAAERGARLDACPDGHREPPGDPVTWTRSSAICRRVANPPSKLPLLTLIKQARAFGLGIVLATQNPVDLDYKALSNIGTWFLGRLQTERDKARVIEGLEGASAARGRSSIARAWRRRSPVSASAYSSCRTCTRMRPSCCRAGGRCRTCEGR